jgi:hypothetical protein
MIGASKTREHRARELLNLVTLATRCANLPGLDEAQRRHWRDEARRALAEIHDVWPDRPAWEDELPRELK